MICRTREFLLTGFMAIPLIACTPVQTSLPDTPPLPDTFDTNTDAPLPMVNWWQAFGDDELNLWVERALAQNYSLKAADARVRQSLSLLTSSRSERYPTVDASVGKERTWVGDDTTNTVWAAGLSTQYEVDIWGGIRAAAAQSEFTLAASEAAYRTLANTVAGQVTTAWLGLRLETETLDLLAQQKQRLDTALKVIEGRQRRGQAVLTDVLQQQQLLESVQVDLLAAQARRDIYRQELSLWSGEGLSPLSDADLNALSPVPALNEGQQQVALEALRARPDVQQAFYSLQAASAGVAVAVANRYPRFTLSASYQGEDPQLSQVLDNWVANLAGSLVLPVLDGGQRRAEVKRQQAIEAEALADYTQTLLEAAQEVQEALILDAQHAATLERLSVQLDLARRSLTLAESYYSRGQFSFLELVNAQQDLLSLEVQYLNTRWNRLQARIQLYKSVSHGQFGEQSL